MRDYANDQNLRLAQKMLEQQGKINDLTVERDGAYRERAQLLALLAALHPSVIAPAPDVDEDDWQILYLRIGGKQASWHIAPRDAELYAHVEHVSADDRRAQWDGHTTEQKYAHIGQHAAQLYAEARGRVETPQQPDLNPPGSTREQPTAPKPRRPIQGSGYTPAQLLGADLADGHAVDGAEAEAADRA